MLCNRADLRASNRVMFALGCREIQAGIAHGALAFAFVSGVANLQAASFDCAKAQRPVEKVICGDAKLNAADESLGRMYRASLAKLPTAAVGELRVDQVQWLAWVQEVCQADVPGRAPAATAVCMEPVYTERLKLLRGAVARRNGITFLTRTQYIAAPEPKSEVVGMPDFPGFGTLQVSWPEATEAAPAWKAWNRAVETQAYPVEEGRAASKVSPPKELRWTADLAEGQDTELVLQLRSIEHGWVTTTISWNSMGHGAAHPNESFSTMTWLLDSGRELRVDDVFAPGSAWKTKVAAICWAQIQKQGQDAVYPEVKGPNAKPLLDDITDILNWTLETDGLHISYPEYSISPRASPIDDAVIPWAQLKPVLAQGFVTP